jgi:pimeloyl-ACP methyl ester carboxylesterase
MLTCFPKLLYNFIYRDLTFKDVYDNPAEAARWFAARDLIIAATFCRHFWWHTLMLWPWELPDPSVFVLSGKDDLVPSELVHKQLEGAPSHVHVLTHPDLYHGHFLFRPAWQAVIVARFKAALEEREARERAAAKDA